MAFYMRIVSNTCLRSPWVRLLVSQIRHWNFEMAPCSDSWYLSSKKLSTWEPNNLILIDWILVGVICTRICYGNFHTVTTHSWMWSSTIRHTVFWALWGIRTPEKRTDYDWKKWWSTIRLWHWPPGVRQTLALVGWFDIIDGQCIFVYVPNIA